MMQSIRSITAFSIAAVLHTLFILWTIQLPVISIKNISFQNTLPVTEVSLVHLAPVHHRKPKAQEKNALHQVQDMTQELLNITLSTM